MLKFITGLVLLSTSPLTAAGPYTPHLPNPIVEPWRWRSFPEMEGHELRCMAEDTKGHVWFGTDSSVLRYDGLVWTSYGPDDGLDGQMVVALTADENGIYCATLRSIYRFEGERWVRVFPFEGDLTWFFSDLAVGPDGRLWASTPWGLLRVRGREATLYTTEEVQQSLKLSAPFVTCSIVPPHLALPEKVPYGRLGFQRINDTVVLIIAGGPAEAAGIRIGDRLLHDESHADHTRLTIDRQGESEPVVVSVANNPGSGTVRIFDLEDICLARNGSLWAGLSTQSRGGVVHFDPDSGVWTHHDDTDKVLTGGRLHLLESDIGEIWAVSDHRSRGTSRFDGTKWTTTWLSDVGGLDLNPSITQTRDGTIWVGGHEGILHALRDGRWEVYRTPDIPIPTTRVIGLMESSDGALWILGNGREPIRLDYATTRWTTYDGLNYQTQDTTGRLWFLEADGAIVSQEGTVWTRYDVTDGLIDAPTGIASNQSGEVCVVGSHKGEAAASTRFSDGKWRRETFPDLSWGVDGRAVYESSDGALWLGAAVDWFRERGHRGGVVRILDGQTTRFTPPDILRYVYGIGETADGRVWIGSRRGLHYFDGSTWTRVTTPPELVSRVDVLHTTTEGDLLVGHRTRGVYRYDGTSWTLSNVRDGLADNTIRSILESRDGSVWTVTDRAISRYDGQAWTTPALPAGLTAGLRSALHQSGDGAIWINCASEAWHRRGRPTDHGDQSNIGHFLTIRYEPDQLPPETTITFALETVSQPGNTTLSWSGADPWSETETEDLQYAWRIDELDWSDYSDARNHTFEQLGSGAHLFEVRARDRAFNEDDTPAFIRFTVTPPVWQQAWFIILVTLFSGAVLIQTSRVVLRGRDLTRSNTALTGANAELSTLNVDLVESNRQLEETRDQLVLSEKMASLGNLVAGVAHEVNTPLGAFNSAADTLKRCIERISRAVNSATTAEDVRKDTQYQRAIKILDETTDTAVVAGERVTNIIDSLRHFAHLDEAEYHRVDLHESLDSIVTLKAHDLTDRISITKNYGDIPPVTCYASELNQVFMNIFTNAIDAIDAVEGSGSIEIETGCTNDQVVVSFSDTGSGIKPDDLGHIFDPGFTTKGVGVGVGLGLATAYRIIQKHGGRIDVTSEERKGSTFSVCIPLVVEEGA